MPDENIPAVEIDVSIPEQGIWWKNQRVWRTLFSGVISLLTVIPAVFLILEEHWPSGAWGAAAAQLLLVQSAVTRIMAIDGVDRFLTHFGLGSTPRGSQSAIDPREVTVTVADMREVDPS